MHALAVIYVLRALEGIEAFKVIQHTSTELEVLVVPNQRWKGSERDLIIEQLGKRLGAVDIDLNLVESIPAEKSGKHRYVVSHVKLPMR